MRVCAVPAQLLTLTNDPRRCLYGWDGADLLKSVVCVQAEATLNPHAGLAAAEDTASDGAAAQRRDGPSRAATACDDGRAPAAKRRREDAVESSGDDADTDQDGQDARRAKRPRFWQQQQYTQVLAMPCRRCVMPRDLARGTRLGLHGSLQMCADHGCRRLRASLDFKLQHC